ncbi:MAG TPA: CAP domain-containing protein [Solirubrobacteraceae bacterium]|jgi:uncharacterized protein YkwD|nr:CAP domain-containing protein [Solirubrobacteraceae bacterium]
MTPNPNRLATALLVGLSLILPPVLVAPSAAAAASRHARSSSATHRRPHRRHKPTKMGVATVKAPVPAGAAPSSAARLAAAAAAAAAAARQAAASAAQSAAAAAGQSAAAVGAGVTTTARSGACGGVNVVPNASNVAAIGAATLCLINQLRQAAGLVALTENADLGAAAAAHSAAMVAEDYFDHVGPDGVGVEQRIRATGYVPHGPGGAIGENIAAATRSDATPAATVAAWMRSAGHRANILNPDFTVTGLGVTGAVPRLLGRRSGGTYTEDFA